MRSFCLEGVSVVLSGFGRGKVVLYVYFIPLFLITTCRFLHWKWTVFNNDGVPSVKCISL